MAVPLSDEIETLVLNAPDPRSGSWASKGKWLPHRARGCLFIPPLPNYVQNIRPPYEIGPWPYLDGPNYTTNSEPARA